MHGHRWCPSHQKVARRMEKNTPAHKTPGVFGFLTLSVLQADLFMHFKTLPGVPAPSAMQRVPPRSLVQHLTPDREPPRSPLLQYRSRFSPRRTFIGSARRVGPTLARWPYLLRVATQLTESPPRPRASCVPAHSRFRDSQVRQSLLAYQRRRAPDRTVAYAPPQSLGLRMSARRDSIARDLPGSILRHATD